MSIDTLGSIAFGIRVPASASPRYLHVPLPPAAAAGDALALVAAGDALAFVALGVVAAAFVGAAADAAGVVVVLLSLPPHPAIAAASPRNTAPAITAFK
jgi:hypothetical protein